MNTYVVAVSGGVDSVCLLDMLCRAQAPEYSGATFVVAHFDHGIREDSHLDRQFVAELAQKYDLLFETSVAELGPDASEERARTARYEFLQEVKRRTSAKAIITAHHLDDRLETAVLNILRGTSARGLISLRSTEEIHRPLLERRKSWLMEYARANNLAWREDSTNLSDAYARNYIRHHIMPRLEPGIESLIHIVTSTDKIYSEIDDLLPDLDELDYVSFVSLPFNVACEIMTSALRKRNISDYTALTIERLVVFSRCARIGTKTDIDSNWWLIREKQGIVFKEKR